MRTSTPVFAPVGATLENGYDSGGARTYPWNSKLAITPPAMYSDYIGSATGLVVGAPVAALPATAGQSTAAAQVAANPWGRYSHLPWLIGGLILAVGAMYFLHYKERRTG